MSKNEVRKFQPYISQENSLKQSFVPQSINCIFLSLKCIEEFTINNPECNIIYVLKDESSGGSKLIPIRNEKREFLVFFTRKDGY